MSWLQRLHSFFTGEPDALSDDNNSHSYRKWRLWQLEPTRDCDLRCLMCPWHGLRPKPGEARYMREATWRRLAPYLGEVQSIDFTGSGEPLLNPHLFDWLTEAGNHGCQTGFLTNGLLLDNGAIRRLLEAAPEWIGFSVDAAEKELYERIRRGSDFATVCSAIRSFCQLRSGDRPLVMINFVIMDLNLDQLEGIIRLAHSLGVDQVNFKQCDVIRAEYGRSLGLFAETKSRQTAKLQKKLGKVRRLAKKLGIRTTAFSFYPDQQPVCDQDPRGSLFIRSDGITAPCINLAYGGSSTFFNEKVNLPDTHFGDVMIAAPEAIWSAESCRSFRRCFDQRVAQYEASLAAADFGHDLVKFNEALDQAVQSMGPAPPGCRICHYLYGV